MPTPQVQLNVDVVYHENSDFYALTFTANADTEQTQVYMENLLRGLLDPAVPKQAGFVPSGEVGKLQFLMRVADIAKLDASQNKGKQV